MKKLFLSIMVLLTSTQARAELQTVPYIDVARYLGTWYEISRNILPFAGDCQCARQVLGVKSNGNVSVFNSCNFGSVRGPLRQISGEAVNDDPTSNSKFTVDFNLPTKGKYWVIGLAADYRYAVVSDPSMRSLYILSKTPKLDLASYEEARALAARQVDTSKLQITEQDGCTYP